MEQDDSTHRFDVPPERALLVIDMQGYSKIPEAKKEAARSDVDEILGCVLAHGGLRLPQEGDDAYEDTGDGMMLQFPPHFLARLIDPVLVELNAALVRYQRERRPSAPLRLRASVHVGPVKLPKKKNDAIVEADRLVNCGAVYRGLTAAAECGSFLAAVVSETAYRRTVAAGRTPQLGAHHFLLTPARVEGKPDIAEQCRLHVPGLTAPGLRPYMREADAAPDEERNDGTDRISGDTPPVHKSGADGPGAGPDTPTFAFHGTLHRPNITGSVNTMRIDQRGN